jgi:hypothetical protein
VSPPPRAVWQTGPVAKADCASMAVGENIGHQNCDPFLYIDRIHHPAHRNPRATYTHCLLTRHR